MVQEFAVLSANPMKEWPGKRSMTGPGAILANGMKVSEVGLARHNARLWLNYFGPSYRYDSMQELWYLHENRAERFVVDKRPLLR